MSRFLAGALLIFLFGCQEERDIRVLVLGNSITQHGPLPAEGWYGNWGMAASKADSDFVHVLSARLDVRYKHVDLRARNIAYWENDFAYDFSAEELLAFEHDVLVIRIGENVKTLDGYGEAVEKLITTFHGKKVVVTGTFWTNQTMDSIYQKVCAAHGYRFVKLSDLVADETNMAMKTFQGGVGAHPSDKGMRQIAERIYEEIVRVY